MDAGQNLMLAQQSRIQISSSATHHQDITETSLSINGSNKFANGRQKVEEKNEKTRRIPGRTLSLISYQNSLKKGINAWMANTFSPRKPPPSNPSLWYRLHSCCMSRRCLLGLVIFLSFLATILIVLLMFVSLQKSVRQVEDVEFLNQDTDWRSKCERPCVANFDVPPLVLISMDAFWSGFLARNLTPAIQRIMQCGTTADFMTPSYPSKTFPNHYTIATGLYPEAHGIIDNKFIDTNIKNNNHKFTIASKVADWYSGEPIWNTVYKNGKKSATFFWPGSEVPIQGNMPTYRYTFDLSHPFSKRVDQIIKWLEMDEGDRPAFLTMYFEQPDVAMHAHGPDSDAVNTALIQMDAMVNYLVSRLDQKNYLGCINMVIVSDHGAQKLRRDHFVSLDEFIDTTDTSAFISAGIVSHIKFSKPVNLTAKIEPFRCKGGGNFRMYTKSTMPRRYHFSKNRRIGDIILDSTIGSKIYMTKKALKAEKDKGDHGYDNRAREMQAIFAAYGPSIKPKNKIKEFQNIELYNLFASLMQLANRAPNNGTFGVLNGVLKHPPEIPQTPISELQDCEDFKILKCGDGCHFNRHSRNSDSSHSRSMSESQSSEVQRFNRKNNQKHTMQKAIDQGSHSFFSTLASKVDSAVACDRNPVLIFLPLRLQKNIDLCIVRLCNATLTYSRRYRTALLVESHLSAPISNIDHRLNCSARLSFSSRRPASSSFILTTQATRDTEPGVKSGEQTLQSLSSTISSLSHDEKAQKVSVLSNNIIERAPQSLSANVFAKLSESESLSQTQKTDLKLNDSEAKAVSYSAVNSTFEISTDEQECSSKYDDNASSKKLWIPLFFDDDYARYLVEGQLRVPKGFYTDIWPHVRDLIRQYVQHYRKLLMWTGPVWDSDFDVTKSGYVGGPFNEFELEYRLQSSTASAQDRIKESEDNKLSAPTHMFLVLVRCSITANGRWSTDGRHCDPPESTVSLAFMLPLVDNDFNCLFPAEYISRHSVRIRDIELVTGLEWFTERSIYSPELAVRLRTAISQRLWQLELPPIMKNFEEKDSDAKYGKKGS